MVRHVQIRYISSRYAFSDSGMLQDMPGNLLDVPYRILLVRIVKNSLLAVFCGETKIGVVL